MAIGTSTPIEIIYVGHVKRPFRTGVRAGPKVSATISDKVIYPTSLGENATRHKVTHMAWSLNDVAQHNSSRYVSGYNCFSSLTFVAPVTAGSSLTAKFMTLLVSFRCAQLTSKWSKLYI